MDTCLDESTAFIFQRRSIRAYESRPLDDAVIEHLLKAAMAAPSACARDPWRFVVAVDPATRHRIADCLPHGGMVATAAAGILVCGDLTAAHDGQLSYLLQDCSACIQNILLAASALELGACWLGIHPREERMDAIRRSFALPETIIPVSCVAVGHPAEHKPARTRYTSAYVHRERW